jgi:hypothetical protein
MFLLKLNVLVYCSQLPAIRRGNQILPEGGVAHEAPVFAGGKSVYAMKSISIRTDASCVEISYQSRDYHSVDGCMQQ